MIIIIVVAAFYIVHGKLSSRILKNTNSMQWVTSIVMHMHAGIPKTRSADPDMVNDRCSLNSRAVLQCTSMNIVYGSIVMVNI